MDNAIAAHLNWKLKILEEFKNRSNNLDSQTVRDATLCDLGKWIKKTEAALKDNPDYINIVRIHKDFHQCAANIIQKIQNGSIEDLDILLTDLEADSDSEYSQYSKEVVRLLNSLKLKGTT